MKGLYEKIDKTRFEIVGVVGDSPPDVLEKIINEKAITWPQILSDDTNKIKEKYGISMYPTNFLLDTEGTIIAKNIIGKELENKILNLLNNKLQ
jgi:peroxiredoxin